MRLKELRLLSLAVALLWFLPAKGLAATAEAKCQNCNNFDLQEGWRCESALFKGGSNCKAIRDSCTVSGSCGGSRSILPVRLPPSQILQIAASHPRVAATAYLFTSEPLTPSEGQVFWHNSEVTISDVEDLIQGRPMELQPTPGEAVIYAVTVQQLAPVNGQARAVLRISPMIPSSLDPSFLELSMSLAQGGDPTHPDLYVPISWQLE